MTNCERARLVGLIGPKGSGKTAIARMLESYAGYRRSPLAAPVKREAMRRILEQCGIGTADAHVYGDKKDEIIPGMGITGRVLQQQIGDEMQDANPNCLLDQWLEEHARHTEPCVVDDVRLMQEAAVLKAQGAVLIQVTRPGVYYTNEHITEDERVTSEAHFYLENRSDLRSALDKLLYLITRHDVKEGDVTYRFKKHQAGWWNKAVGHRFWPYEVTVDGMMCNGFLSYTEPLSLEDEGQGQFNIIEGVSTIRLEACDDAGRD